MQLQQHFAPLVCACLTLPGCLLPPFPPACMHCCFCSFLLPCTHALPLGTSRTSLPMARQAALCVCVWWQACHLASPLSPFLISKASLYPCLYYLPTLPSSPSPLMGILRRRDIYRYLVGDGRRGVSVSARDGWENQRAQHCGARTAEHVQERDAHSLFAGALVTKPQQPCLYNVWRNSSTPTLWLRRWRSHLRVWLVCKTLRCNVASL